MAGVDRTRKGVIDIGEGYNKEQQIAHFKGTHTSTAMEEKIKKEREDRARNKERKLICVCGCWG